MAGWRGCEPAEAACYRTQARVSAVVSPGRF
jgi:hypothetical protein